MKNGRPVLVVFIDSLPFSHIQSLPFLSSLHYGGFRPGFGYSMSNKAQLFAGLTADQTGYLCSWNPSAKPPIGFRFLSNLSTFDANLFATRWLHRLGSRITGKPLGWAPLHLLRYFDRYEINAYEPEFPHETLLDRQGTNRFLYRDFSPGENRDRTLFATAIHNVAKASGLFFVASADLDHVAHRDGVESPTHRDKARELDSLAAELAAAFNREYPDAPIVILSDHGMANITEGIKLDIENLFGPMHPSQYLCGIDATMARFWTKDLSLLDEMTQYAISLPGAHVVNDEERISFGITDRRHGDSIVLLDEGKVFCPSFYFREPPAAMHGYHPESLGQRAFIATANVGCELPTTVEQVYPFLLKLLNEEMRDAGRA